MSGTFGYAATEENDRRSSLCVTAESGLRILNMANLGLFDLQIPSCLMGAQSTLEEIRLGVGPPQLLIFTAISKATVCMN